MAKTLNATPAQVRAARLIVARAERGIGEASEAVRAIADARRPSSDPAPGTSEVPEAPPAP